MEYFGVLWESPGCSIQIKKCGVLVSSPSVLSKKVIRLKALGGRGDSLSQEIWGSHFRKLNLLLTPSVAVNRMYLHKGLVSV